MGRWRAMSSEEEPVAWLRAQIEARKAVAEAAWPGPWDLETEVGGFGPVSCVLMPLGSHEGARTGLTSWTPLGTQDAATADHIAANDPQDTIARCEAELAILDLYERTLAIVRAPVDLKALAAEKPVIRELRARDYLDAERELCVLWEVVSLLVGGHQHRPGYREEDWKP